MIDKCGPSIHIVTPALRLFFKNFAVCPAQSTELIHKKIVSNKL